MYSDNEINFSQFNQYYTDAEFKQPVIAGKSSLDNVPDGIYTVAVERISTGFNPDNDPRLTICFKVIYDKDHNGQYEGAKIYDNVLLFKKGAQLSTLKFFAHKAVWMLSDLEILNPEDLIFQNPEHMRQLAEFANNSDRKAMMSYNLTVKTNAKGYKEYKYVVSEASRDMMSTMGEPMRFSQAQQQAQSPYGANPYNQAPMPQGYPTQPQGYPTQPAQPAQPAQQAQQMNQVPMTPQSGNQPNGVAFNTPIADNEIPF